MNAETTMVRGHLLALFCKNKPPCKDADCICAALERTYLAWLRTSIKFAHFGILVTQLFRLPRDLLPSSPIVSEFYRLGKPLGYVSISIALVVILVGGFRCWQQQQYMVSGKIRSCGWEVWIVLLLTLGVSLSHLHCCQILLRLALTNRAMLI